jgi:hypothetical protein
MINEMERHVHTTAQIAHYCSPLSLLPYQINEAVSIGISQFDNGNSAATAYETGRIAVDTFAVNKIILQAQSHPKSNLVMHFNRWHRTLKFSSANIIKNTNKCICSVLIANSIKYPDFSTLYGAD